MTMNCDKASFLMSKEHDKPLSLREKASLKIHLMICKACIVARNQMNRIREACGMEEMQIPSSPRLREAHLDEECKKRLKSKVKEHLK